MLLLAQPHAACPRAAPAIELKTGHSLAKNSVWLNALIILGVATFAMRGAWAPALLAGHSAWLDFIRMVEFNAAIQAGDYLPTWSPDLYHGYGSPLFQFYAPLVYYVAEIPLLAGLDIASALKTTQLFFLIASGFAMYQLASAHVSRWAACFGAVLYMIAPYRMADIFARHALAEHAAFVWLPLIVWGTERRTRVGFVTAMLASAGLLLTHNVMALIALPLCLAAGWLLSTNKNWKTLLLAGVPAALGVGLACFFWWPALSGRVYTQAEISLTSGHFDYHNHFLSLRELPWQIGLPHLLLTVGALCLFVKFRTRWCGIGIAISSIALVMCLTPSEPIWEALPLLRYVQFPWRFLGLAVFGAAICGAALIDQAGRIYPKAQLPLLGAGTLAVTALYFPDYTQAKFQALDWQTRTLSQANSQQVETIRARGALLSLDQLATPETIRTVGERGTSSDDFLPIGVEEKPNGPAPETQPWERLSFNHYRARVSMRESGQVELHQFWFPGWKATLDGRAVETAPTGKSALVSCEVPVGDHVVEFNYVALPQRRTGFIVSLVSVALAFVAIFKMKGIAI